MTRTWWVRAGLVPALLPSRAAGLDSLAHEHLRVECPNPAAKTTAIVAGMLSGAKSIDAMDRLRHGAMPRLFTAIVAPSTIGTYLRAFSRGQIAQLEDPSRGLPGQLDPVAQRAVTTFRSRATSATGFPVSSTIRTAPSRNSRSYFFRFSGIATPYS